MRMAQIQLQHNTPVITNQLLPNNGPTPRVSKVLRISGCSIFAMGIAEIIITIILIVVPSNFSCAFVGIFSWQLCAGVLAIVTGSFGLCGDRKTCLVIAYLVLCVITALSGACGVIIAGRTASCALRELHYTRFYNTDSGKDKLHAALYVVLCVIFVCQIPVSNIGASFTCKAICRTDNRQLQQVIVYQPNSVPGQTINSPGAHMVITCDNANQQLSSPLYCPANPPDYEDIGNNEKLYPNGK